MIDLSTSLLSTRPDTLPSGQRSKLHRQVLVAFAAVSVPLIVAASLVQHQARLALPDTDAKSILTVIAGVWVVILILAWRALIAHPHMRFGAANTVTLCRAAGTAVLAGLIPIAGQLSEHGLSLWFWCATAVAIILLTLDGLDGYLARQSGLSSAFGARFDMEIDALLALVLSAMLWQSGEAGLWIMGLGLMRYAFVAGGIFAYPLRAELYPSLRRKAVCVIQLSVLCAMVSPLIQAPLSTMLGVTALICLSGSFGRDIRWLYRHRSH